VPLTLDQYEKKLREPALCEQLAVRDYLDDVVVRTNGGFVAGYVLKGLTSYFASDEGRNRGKLMMEALLRSIPEQSMRVQFRYEVLEDLGNLLDQHVAGQRSENPEAIALDAARVEQWRAKEANGHYIRPLLHVYFIWDPVLHHRIIGKPLKPKGDLFNLSARKCIDRAWQEHQDLLAEFESLLRGVETTLQAAELGATRLSDDALFLEAKRALNPLHPDSRPYRRGEAQLEYRSARQQIADVSIVDETDTYLNLDGVFYTFVTLKELPDATFPGILRELTALDFPVVVTAQVTIPDQAKILKGYKTRLRKMQAAQRDSHGGFRVNVEAQVAESQLLRAQQDIISSSVKTARLSLVISTRTSQPAATVSELEQAERTIENRRQGPAAHAAAWWACRIAHIYEMSRGSFGRAHPAGVSSAPPIRRSTFHSDRGATAKTLSGANHCHYGSGQTLAAGADRHGGRGVRDWQDTDPARSHSCPRRRKSVHRLSDGSTTPGGEVGAGSVSDLAGVARVPTRRFAEWRRREQISRSERSAVEAGPHRA